MSLSSLKRFSASLLVTSVLLNPLALHAAGGKDGLSEFLDQPSSTPTIISQEKSLKDTLEALKDSPCDSLLIEGLTLSAQDFEDLATYWPVSLKHLSFSGSNLDDSGLMKINPHLSSLESLNLSQTNITDLAASVFKNLLKTSTSLEILDLRDTKISSESVSSLRTAVSNSNSLQYLLLEGTALEPKQITRLQNKVRGQWFERVLEKSALSKDEKEALDNVYGAYTSSLTLTFEQEDSNGWQALLLALQNSALENPENLQAFSFSGWTLSVPELLKALDQHKNLSTLTWNLSESQVEDFQNFRGVSFDARVKFLDLTGSPLTKFPYILWQNLETLNLTNTGLTDQKLKNLSYGLVRHRSLKHLVLDGNDVSLDGVGQLISEGYDKILSAQDTPLERAAKLYSQIQAASQKSSFTPIPEKKPEESVREWMDRSGKISRVLINKLSNSFKLWESNQNTRLNLSEENLTSQEIEELSPFLPAHLRNLNLSGNPQIGPGLSAFVRSLPSLTDLRSLNLSGATMDSATSQDFVQTLPQLTKLNTLRLDETGLDDQAIISLSKVLPRMKKLSSLFLVDNPITDGGVQTLLETLPFMESLTEIKVKNDQIRPDLIKSLNTTLEALETKRYE